MCVCVCVCVCVFFFFFFFSGCTGRAQVRSIKVTLHGKSLGVPEMAGPMSAAVIKGALNLLLAQEVCVVVVVKNVDCGITGDHSK